MGVLERKYPPALPTQLTLELQTQNTGPSHLTMQLQISPLERQGLYGLGHVDHRSHSRMDKLTLQHQEPEHPSTTLCAVSRGTFQRESLSG